MFGQKTVFNRRPPRRHCIQGEGVKINGQRQIWYESFYKDKWERTLAKHEMKAGLDVHCVQVSYNIDV